MDTKKIWIYGLRNPWKFSFHGNNLWIGDVGAGQQDEINRVLPSHVGSNYGWGRWEGTYQDASVSLAGGTLRPPYFSKSATSLTGGYVYDGSLTNPEILGKYVFADYISGDVWAINANAGPDSTNPTLATNRESLTAAKLFTTAPADAAIVSFGRNESGTELYFLRFGQNYDTNPNSSNAYNFANNSGAIFKITGQQSNQSVAVNGIGNFDQCAIDLNGRVNTLETVGNTVWLGGNFTSAQGIQYSKLVTYDKNTGFRATYSVTGEVQDIHAAANGDIWIGGNFTQINGVNAKNLAQISNGSIINHNSSGVVYEIDSAPNGYVYFIGSSTSVSGVSISKFARFNGFNWDNMNTSPNNEVRALEVASNGDIFIGGNFTAVGSVGANRIARYRGSSWSSYPGASSLFIKEIEEVKGYLYVGGQNYFGRYNLSNNTHQILGQNIAGGEVRAITSDGTNIYLGGTFGTASNNGSTNLIMNGLARWTSSNNTFQALGSGINVGTDYAVSALNYANGNLYVGGEFTDIGKYFALWSTSPISCPSTSTSSCEADILNENTSLALNNRSTTGGLNNSGTSSQVNGSACGMQLTSSAGQPFSRYIIPINLSELGISAGQKISISIDGKSTNGNGRMEVVRNNTPNTSILTKSFTTSWSTQAGEITVPSGVTSLDIWLFNNYNNSNLSGNAYFDNLEVSVVEQATGNCNKDIANQNSSMPLTNRTSTGSITVTGISNGSTCEMQLTSPLGQPFSRYVIPINLAAEGISAGDRINISVDGRSGTGNARIEVNRNNTANAHESYNTFGNSWSTFNRTTTVPSGMSSLDIWLFSNYNISTGSGNAYYRNLRVSVESTGVNPCTKDIANQNTSMPLTNRTSWGNITAAGNSNGALCEMQLTNPSGLAYSRYIIPINLASEGIRAGDRISISIDGKSGSGTARIEVNRNNTPNAHEMYNTFGNSWSTFNRTITVPSGISTLDIWLFSNYGLNINAGTSNYRNLRVSKVSGTAFKGSVESLGNSEISTLKSINLFPNPSTKEITIAFLDGKSYASYNIYGINGALVKKGTINNARKEISIAIETFETGLYLLTLTDNDGENTSLKFMKE